MTKKAKKKIQTDFSQDVSIDKFNLDRECVRQASLVERYGGELALAKKSLAKAKFDKEMLMSEVGLEIRSGNIPEKYASVKVTNESVKEFIEADPAVIAAKKKMFKAQYAVNVLENALVAFSDKRRQLDNLVRLHQTKYFESGGVENERQTSSADYHRANLNHKRDLENEFEDNEEIE